MRHKKAKTAQVVERTLVEFPMDGGSRTVRLLVSDVKYKEILAIRDEIYHIQQAVIFAFPPWLC